jgi:L-histidine N-alpha-methyltransferase
VTPLLQVPVHLRAFAEDVRRGLGVRIKTLSPQYFYDDVGSALFDVITLLPEYGLTRADQTLLARHSSEILSVFGSAGLIAELGSGSGGKTRHILEAAARDTPVLYFPIDVSASALAHCREALESIEGVSICELHQSYLDGLRQAVAQRPAGERVLVLFLGSTIGNFEPEQAHDFLRSVRDQLQPGDGVLLGTDLVKPEARLLLAYDDPLGVTAAFNLNLLARINRELGGTFDLRQFRHEARWSAADSRVEMHLVSLGDQTVRISDLDFIISFAAGETIWTECSHKFEPGEIQQLASASGYTCENQWIDSEWGFAESLLLARE